MIAYDKLKPLISIHVPKCGGSTFRSILKQWYGRKAYFHYYDEKNREMPRIIMLEKGLFDKKFKPGICIHGHFSKHRGIGIVDYYPEVNQFISIIRDPYEIAVSTHFYLKKKKKEGRIFNDSEATKEALGLEEYLWRYKSFLLNHFPGDITIDNYRDVIDNNFIYIGISEDYQFTVDAIAAKLGFETASAKHENQSDRFGELTDEYRNRFIESNRLEFEIYDYVKSNYKSIWVNQSAE